MAIDVFNRIAVLVNDHNSFIQIIIYLFELLIDLVLLQDQNDYVRKMVSKSIQQSNEKKIERNVNEHDSVFLYARVLDNSIASTEQRKDKANDQSSFIIFHILKHNRHYKNHD